MPDGVCREPDGSGPQTIGKRNCTIRGGAKTILFGGCKTTFCRQKGVASALLGRGQNEPYSFLSDVQR